METGMKVLIAILVLCFVYVAWRGQELFGESLYLGTGVDLGGNDRANLYNAGATMRNLGTMFSMTDQDTVRQNDIL